MITEIKILHAGLDSQLEQQVNREIRKAISEHRIIADVKYIEKSAMIIYGDYDYPRHDTGPGI